MVLKSLRSFQHRSARFLASRSLLGDFFFFHLGFATFVGLLAIFGLALPDLGSVDNVKAAFVIYDNKVAADTVSGTIAGINGT